MKNRIITYRQRIDALLAHSPADTDWNTVLCEHLTQVSVTFALLTMIGLAVYCIAEYIPILALIGLLLVLLIPYIGHYYTLENEVQKMYGQYDLILQKLRKSGL